MKKLIFTFSLFCLIAVQSKAQSGVQQYCGDSGPTICTNPDTAHAPGLSPVSDSLAPIVQGVAVNTTIEFENFDTISFAGTTETIQSLKIDTISGLPEGLCWATNVANNTFANEAYGCINVKGTTEATPGQYRLYIIVTANIGINVTTNADAAGLYYYVRLNKCEYAPVVAVDTNGQANGTNIFVPYTDTTTCNVGINDINKTVQSLNVYPNPFSSAAEVSFNSTTTGIMTEKITTILGSEVYSKNIEVVTGTNQHVINRNSLAPGIYFYTISNGNSSLTKKLVIE